MAVNASILYQNQEMCIKTNLWISAYFIVSLINKKIVKMHADFSYSFQRGFYEIILIHYTKMIAPAQTEKIQGMFEIIINWRLYNK